jgi:dynein heavy chain
VQAEAEIIKREKAAAEVDLAAARPFLDEANAAIDSINAQDLVELKGLQKPSDIIKLVFDVVLLLLKQPVSKVVLGTVVLGMGRAKQSTEFLCDSYSLAKVRRVIHTRSLLYVESVSHAGCGGGVQRGILQDINFLRILTRFSEHEKDCLNDETIELIAPYLELEDFDPFIARNASRAGTRRSSALPPQCCASLTCVCVGVSLQRRACVRGHEQCRCTTTPQR